MRHRLCALSSADTRHPISQTCASHRAAWLSPPVKPKAASSASRMPLIATRHSPPLMRSGIGNEGDEHAQWRRAHGAYGTESLTSCLPMLRPFNMPIKARGAFSIPSTMSSRYFNLPACSHSVSCFSALG